MTNRQIRWAVMSCCAVLCFLGVYTLVVEHDLGGLLVTPAGAALYAHLWGAPDDA